MTFSPNHPSVQAWQAKRKCDNCWSPDLPVVRKYNICEECEPLTVRERTNLVNLRAGRQMMRSGLKSRALVGFALFIAGCYTIDINYFGALVLYGLCFVCWQTGLNRWFKEQGL